MTGQPGGIEEILGGTRRGVIVLIAFIVMTGVAIGALAYATFGNRDAEPPTSTPQSITPPNQATQQSTWELPTASQRSEPCPYSPRVDNTGISLTQSGLLVSTMVQTSCDSVDVLSGAGVKVTVSAGPRDVASGIFDLTSNPIVISPGGRPQQQFLFPAGTYWRIPELVTGDTVTIEISDFTRSGSGPSHSSNGFTLTAVRPAPPAHGSAEETARSALPETAAYDLPWARNNLENWWVSQISSKKLELEADGITYDNNEILRDHLVRRQRYNNVRLLYSEDWTVFNGSNWWISVVGQPYSDAASANRWCDENGIESFNCFAKLISRFYGPEGSTVLRK